MLKDVHRDYLEVVTLEQGSSLPEVVAGRWKSVVVGAAPSPAGYAAGPLVSRVPVASYPRRRDNQNVFRHFQMSPARQGEWACVWQNHSRLRTTALESFQLLPFDLLELQVLKKEKSKCKFL